MLRLMLDGLDAIDWASVTHAYGPADDVPDMIRAMTSDDAEIRQQAFYQAYGNIWHQGTVYAATAPAVPFLLELAAAPTLPDRHRVLELLFHLAHGSSYLDVHQHLSVVGETLKEQRDFGDDLAEELKWVQAATAAVAAGKDVYLTLLSDDVPAVRRHAARMLTCCPDHRSEIVPALIRTLDFDDDAGARATALSAVAALAANDEEALIQRALTDDTPLVRLAAALSSAFYLSESPGPEVIDTLVEFLDQADQLPYEELVFGDDCASDIGAALARVKGPRRIGVAERLLAVAEGGRAAPLTVAEPLLQLAFDGVQVDPTLEKLSDLQIRTLRYLASKAWSKTEDGSWSVFGNFVELLEDAGLDRLGRAVIQYDEDT